MVAAVVVADLGDGGWWRGLPVTAAPGCVPAVGALGTVTRV